MKFIINMIAGAVIAAGLGAGVLAAASPAQADICDKHNAGEIYVHACAHGHGGAGPMVRWFNEETGRYEYGHKGDEPKAEHPCADGHTDGASAGVE
jgi:hypothetical protein